MSKSRRKKVMFVCGARPNFMKIAPILKEMQKYPRLFDPLIVHTGQHYDKNMSDLFFKDLNLPEPDIFLEVGAASHTVQTARIMTRFEKAAKKTMPDLIIVVGDVNSTMACSLVASKLMIPLAHVEAGLRSFDRSMPEEINRIVTDTLSDHLFVNEESGLINLKREGIVREKTYFVGNIMIDALFMNMNKINRSNILRKILPGRKTLKRGSYAVLTLHRPSNVDSRSTLLEAYDILKDISKKINVIYPIHPRTEKMLKKYYRLRGYDENGIPKEETLRRLGIV